MNYLFQSENIDIRLMNDDDELTLCLIKEL